MTRIYLNNTLDPWRDFDRMGRWFNRAGRCECEFPAVNVWVNGENAEISSEIPGIEKETLDISVEGSKVTLKGTRPEYMKKDDESWHRHEIRHGNFSKTIQLPFNIDADKVHASYKNGILNVSLPQLEADKPKKIQIKTE